LWTERRRSIRAARWDLPCCSERRFPAWSWFRSRDKHIIDREENVEWRMANRDAQQDSARSSNGGCLRCGRINGVESRATDHERKKLWLKKRSGKNRKARESRKEREGRAVLTLRQITRSLGGAVKWWRSVPSAERNPTWEGTGSGSPVGSAAACRQR
jgi:hypothetical protein